MAAKLGKTLAVCRSSYVHPVVLDSFRAGRLAELWNDGPKRVRGRLDRDERRLLTLLRALGR